MSKNDRLIKVFPFFLFPAIIYGGIVDKIVAKVGDEVILLSEVEERTSRLLAVLPSNERIGKKEIMKRVLEDLVEEKLFMLEAKKLKMKVEDDEIDAEIENLKRKYPSETAFYSALEKEGKNLAQLKEEIKEGLLVKKVLYSQILSKIKVSEEEIKNFYEEYKKDLSPPPKVCISQIWIKLDHPEEEIEEIVEEIKSRLKKGEDFYSLARQYSEGPFREKGGRIGYLPETQLLPEIRIALRSIKVGGITPPIRSNDGIRFIKLEGIQYSPPPSLEEVREKIKRIIFKRKTQEAINEWIEKKKKEYGVEIRW